MSTVCGHCDEVFDRRKSPCLTCSGFCGKTYQANCMGISLEFLQCLKSPGFCWFCTDCFKIRNKYEAYMKNSFDNKLTLMINGFESMFEDLKKQILETANNTFANITAANKNEKTEIMPSYAKIVNTKSVVIVKPKNAEQNNIQTKRDIMENIDPVDLNIKVSQIKQVKDGGILISCDDSIGAKNFKDAAAEKLSAQYKISDVKTFLPKVRIVGLTDQYSDEDILKYLKGQNDALSSVSHLKILKTWATKRNANIFQTLVEVDAATYGLIMNRAKLFVNYDACAVYEATDIRVCFKCSGFSHSQSNCVNNDTVCPKCSGCHSLFNCTSSILRCINCVTAKLDDVEHAVWDADKCPIYKKKLNHLKSTNFIRT